MKKYICTFISFVVAISFCATAFAADSSTTEVTANNGSAGHGVYATLESAGTPATIYSVDVAWGSMQFTYNAEVTKRTWNPDTHKYETITEKSAEWTHAENSNVITVTNSSNAAVTANITANINSEFSEVDASVTNGQINLADPSLTTPAVATEGSATIELSGTLPSTAGTNATIGSVTVTISKTEEQE